MFSSTYTSNPFPSFPSSSSYPPLPFFIDPENAFPSNTFLHDPLAVVPFMPTQAPIPETVTNLTVADYGAMLQKDAINVNGAHYGSTISSFIIKKPAKRDRNSKIHTSQGLRDRRVRLSSEIARKFFDLQDMLEYNKPSNTLEWLFTKSENAIKELVRSKHRCSGSGGDGDAKCFCFSSEVQLQGVVDSNDKSLVGGGAAAKERKLKWVEKEDVSVQVQAKKESREKARARARQRTSSKICSTGSGRVQDMEERLPAIANPQILHQLMPSIQSHDEACARWPQLVHYPHLDGFDVIEESIVLKRNLKPSLLSFHHQNLGIPKEASFYNSDYHSCPSSSTNWDANGAINGHSNFVEYPA